MFLLSLETWKWKLNPAQWGVHVVNRNPPNKQNA
jgi:hypothetical protein